MYMNDYAWVESGIGIICRIAAQILQEYKWSH